MSHLAFPLLTSVEELAYGLFLDMSSHPSQQESPVLCLCVWDSAVECIEVTVVMEYQVITRAHKFYYNKEYNISRWVKHRVHQR